MAVQIYLFMALCVVGTSILYFLKHLVKGYIEKEELI